MNRSDYQLCQGLTNHGRLCNRKQKFFISEPDGITRFVRCQYYCTQHCNSWIKGILSDASQISIPTINVQKKERFYVRDYIHLKLSRFKIKIGDTISESLSTLNQVCNIIKFLPTDEIIPMQITLLYNIPKEYLKIIPENYHEMDTKSGKFILSNTIARIKDSYYLQYIKTISIRKK